MKRILKIVGILLVVILLLIVAAPFLFKGKIERLLQQTINKQLTATVSWESLDLSILRSFPDASVRIQNYTVVNAATPYENDTLAHGDAIQLKMGVKQLFKSANEDPIIIDELILEAPVLNLKIDSLGMVNYDIVKNSEETSNATEEASTPFSFDVSHYELQEAIISYTDLDNSTTFLLSDIYHEGTGDFSTVESTLQTQTRGLISLSIDSLTYLKENQLRLDADFQMNLEDQKYTFLKNTGYINALPLQFDGFVQILETGNLIDLTFETPNSDFKNFLGIIPEAYAKNLDRVATEGDFRVSGMVKGQITEDRIPTLDILIQSANASFKYPDLPKRVDGIQLDIVLKNESGLLSDTFIAINEVRFQIENDPFLVQGMLRNLTENMLVNLTIDGKLNLANIEKVYPLALDQPLSGILTADLTTSFDMNSVTSQQYQNSKSNGTAQLSGFRYAVASMPAPIAISNAKVAFKPGTISLTEMQATTGKSDFGATGTIQNLIPFLLSKEALKGRFEVQSNTFNLDDFSTGLAQSNTTTPKKTTEAAEKALEIPDFIDATISFKAKEVLYDNLVLTNVSGTGRIANQEAKLTGIQSGIFGGKAALSGTVSTQNSIPYFDMELDLSKIDIDQSFKSLELLQNLIPIAKALQGSINSKINLKGTLDAHFSPVLASLSGTAFGQLLATRIQPEKMPLLQKLNDRLAFIDINELNPDNLKTTLSFQDGQVTVAPFEFQVKDIMVTVSGSHTFQNVMDYTLGLKIPAQYLGSEVGGLLAKLTQEERQNVSVILPISLSGNLTQPTINLNTQAAVNDLTNQIVAIQKQRVKDKASDKLEDILGGVLGQGGTNTPTDTTVTTTPSTQGTQVIKDVATDILGGLFGKKKPTSPKPVKKDSTGGL